MTPSADLDLVTYRADPRFSFALGRCAQPGVAPRGFVVGIHDTERKYRGFIDGFDAFAQAHNFVVLAPVFPTGVMGDGNQDGYKVLYEQDLRYDKVLNGMLDQAAEQVASASARLLLHGYSGGAQFAHRYLMLHPHRVVAAAIAAPGEVTLPDDAAHWWAGVGDTHQLFGRQVDWESVSKVAVHLAVGELDTSTRQLSDQPPSRFWADEAARRSANRKDRLSTLHRALAEVGVASRLDFLPGVHHSNGHQPAMECATRFFEEHVHHPQDAPRELAS